MHVGMCACAHTCVQGQEPIGPFQVMAQLNPRNRKLPVTNFMVLHPCGSEDIISQLLHVLGKRPWGRLLGIDKTKHPMAMRGLSCAWNVRPRTSGAFCSGCLYAALSDWQPSAPGTEL